MEIVERQRGALWHLIFRTCFGTSTTYNIKHVAPPAERNRPTLPLLWSYTLHNFILGFAAKVSITSFSTLPVTFCLNSNILVPASLRAPHSSDWRVQCLKGPVSWGCRWELRRSSGRKAWRWFDTTPHPFVILESYYIQILLLCQFATQWERKIRMWAFRVGASYGVSMNSFSVTWFLSLAVLRHCYQYYTVFVDFCIKGLK